MGSGVILLVIVAMWAVVLVPTLLHRHDTSTESRSVDRFSAAMRILARRTAQAPGGREVVMPARPASARTPVVTSTATFPSTFSAETAGPAGWRITRVRPVDPAPAEPARSVRPRTDRPRTDRPRTDRPRTDAAPQPAARPARGRTSLAVRRRRMLLGLLVAVPVTALVAAVAGGRWWLVPAVAGGLLLGYVAHLRAEARRAAALARRRARAARMRPMPSTRAGWATVGGDPVAGTPARWGVGDAAAAGASTEASTSDDTVDGGADGWDPVDVPLPTYVTKAVVPQPHLDEPAYGGWVDGLLDDHGLPVEAPGEPADGDLDEILERRRAVGD